MKPGIRSIVIMFALAAALAGCGSDDASTADDPTGESSSPAASETPTPSPSVEASVEATPSESPSLPATDDPTESVPLPACDTVWVEGQKFPRNYEGCMEGEKTIQADGLYCEFGKPLFTYGKHFYAVQNGPVNRTQQVLAKDKTYQSAQRKCGG